MESEFGISGFVSDCRGFSCVIKQRFQDFIVHEIDREGCVVRLTNVDRVPDCDIDQGSKLPKEDGDSLWNVEIAHQLRDLADGNRTEAVTILCQDAVKSERTEIHNSIRNQYPSLQSATSSENGMQRIVVTRGANDRRSRKRTHWPSERNGEYIRFVLYKENRDCHFATSLISRLLGTKPGSIAIAGTKDRRAVTSQLATVYRVPAEKLVALNSQLRGIRLGDFSYCQDQLFLGDSRGNRFTIVMRNVKSTESVIAEDLVKWRERGFINFFGTQRFGTTAVPTYEIGKAILRKQWEEVVDLLLRPRESAPEGLAECYRVWASSKDPVKALSVIPSKRRHTCLEGLLLAGLKKHGVKDVASALRFIPRNSRTLYVHSFQSLVWNKLVAKRVSKYGQQLLTGDLVASSDIGDNDKLEGHPLSVDQLSITEPFRLLVPLPSADAEFANEEMLIWYNEILAEEGITPADLKAAEKEYSVHGGLRKVFIKPSDVSYGFYRYNDPMEPLVLSDYDVLMEKKEPETIEDGKYLALSIQFSLPTGSYATMAIRELCRVETGKLYQSSLNDYAEGDGKETLSSTPVNEGDGEDGEEGNSGDDS